MRNIALASFNYRFFHDASKTILHRLKRRRLFFIYSLEELLAGMVSAIAFTPQDARHYHGYHMASIIALPMAGLSRFSIFQALT